MVHAVIVFFLVYLSYLNVYFKYVFAFFSEGQGDYLTKMRMDYLLFVNFL